MSQLATLPNNSPATFVINKPLLVAVLAAVVVHLVFLFSIKAHTSEQPAPISRSIDITLVNTPSEKAPEKAQLLAEENQLGSGQQDQKPAPAKPAVVPKQEKPAPKAPPEKIKPVAQEKPQPKAPPEKIKTVLKERLKENESVLSKLETQQKMLVQRKAEQKIVIPEILKQPFKESPPNVKQKIVTPSKPTTSPPTERHRISAANLQQQIAEMGTQIRQQPVSVTKTKSVSQVSANKYVAAQYLTDWENKVAGVGNRNYPAAATKAGFSATLTMEVYINADGGINSMRITQSSGNPELDEAAKNIVRMSAPFPPLPSALLKELDVLKITRVWKFSDESGLVTR